MELSVIIPAQNEGKNLKEFFSQLKSVLSNMTSSFEVIVVASEPNNTTADMAEKEDAVVLSQSAKGYGFALKESFKTARGKYILTLDADLTHYPTFIYKMWKCREQAEIIIASRYTAGGIARMPYARYALSLLLNKVYKKILSLPVHDLSSGFRLYRSHIIQELDLCSENFDVLEEILIKAYISGYAIKEIPFIYQPRKEGKSNVQYFKFFISFLATLYKMWKLRNTIQACDYDERAYNSPIPFQRYWQRQRHNIIVNAAFKLNFVLDIGCGSSRILNTLPNAIGMDIDIKKMRHMRQYESPVLCASAFQLPFKNETFDGIVCSEVIEHIQKDDILFKEMARVLKPGGTLILGTPDYGSTIWILIEALYKKLAPGGYGDEHISHYTRKDMLTLVESHGFQFQKIDYIFRSEMIAVFTKT